MLCAVLCTAVTYKYLCWSMCVCVGEYVCFCLCLYLYDICTCIKNVNSVQHEKCSGRRYFFLLTLSYFFLPLLLWLRPYLPCYELVMNFLLYAVTPNLVFLILPFAILREFFCCYSLSSWVMRKFFEQHFNFYFEFYFNNSFHLCLSGPRSKCVSMHYPKSTSSRYHPIRRSPVSVKKHKPSIKLYLLSFSYSLIFAVVPYFRP